MHKFLICFSFVSSFLCAQTSFDKLKFDFGELYKHSDRFVDFKIINHGAKKVFLLRLDKPRPISSLYNTDVIAPGDTMWLRLQVNPSEIGYFNYKVNVYLSDAVQPTSIQLTGNVKALDITANAMQACPDFSQQPKRSGFDKFDLTIVTVEKDSGKPIKNTIVSMIQNGMLSKQEKSDKNGTIKEKGSSGFFYFYARHEGYLSTEKGIFVNPDNHYVVLKLERNPAYQPIEENIVAEQVNDTTPTIEEKEHIVSIFDTATITMDNQEEIVAIETDTTNPTLTSVPISLENIPLTNFSETNFKPNNITFVLDISMSMRVDDKMELMKFALNQLADYIRPQDNISIVTYASFAQIIVSNASGNDKEAIKKTVSELKGGGYTAGGTGIKLGYKQVRKGYIEGGNNEVIVITDGAFNRGDEDYKKYIRKYTRKGYVISVVGIKNNPNDEEEMRSVAELGNGRYIPIFKLEDAKWNLIHEMRKASFKK